MKKKKKKKKINKKKFLSRIFFLLAIPIFIIFLITKPSKKEVPKYAITVVVNNNNITNELAHAPYINKDNVLYLSLEDVGKIFDKKIYFEQETRKVITTSETKVAAIDVVNNILELNGTSLVLNNGILDYGENQYSIPISELSKVYNIESFIKEKSAVISSLYDEFATIKATKKIKLKEEAKRIFKYNKKNWRKWRIDLYRR